MTRSLFSKFSSCSNIRRDWFIDIVSFEFILFSSECLHNPIQIIQMILCLIRTLYLDCTLPTTDVPDVYRMSLLMAKKIANCFLKKRLVFIDKEISFNFVSIWGNLKINQKTIKKIYGSKKIQSYSARVWILG